MEFSEIQSKLTSDKLDVLQACSAYMDKLMDKEQIRGQRAEDKAQALLNLGGVCATILAGILGLFYQNPPTVPAVLLILLGCSLGLPLIKSIYYSLKVIEPLKGYQANEELVFNSQRDDVKEFLRQDIVDKVWLFQKNLSFVNSKLFYLHRAVRNIAAFIVVILLMGFVFFIFRLNPALVNHYFAYIGSGVVVLLLAVMDTVSEQKSKLWGEEN